MYSFAVYIRDQMAWSERTFGPGRRTKGLIEHIRKELLEIEAAPDDLEEWIDIIILGIDGAWRTGTDVADIVESMERKQHKNFSRQWGPNQGEDHAIEHVRTPEEAAIKVASLPPIRPDQVARQEDDPINHPPHYTSHPSGVECITVTEHMGFNLGNAVKYIWRADLKSDSPIEDLKKAAWYIQREIERLS